MTEDGGNNTDCHSNNFQLFNNKQDNKLFDKNKESRQQKEKEKKKKRKKKKGAMKKKIVSVSDQAFLIVTV